MSPIPALSENARIRREAMKAGMVHTRALEQALLAGDIRAVADALEGGAVPDWVVFPHSHDALTVAFRHKSLDLVRLLLDAGAGESLSPAKKTDQLRNGVCARLEGLVPLLVNRLPHPATPDVWVAALGCTAPFALEDFKALESLGLLPRNKKVGTTMGVPLTHVRHPEVFRHLEETGARWGPASGPPGMHPLFIQVLPREDAFPVHPDPLQHAELVRLLVGHLGKNGTLAAGDCVQAIRLLTGGRAIPTVPVLDFLARQCPGWSWTGNGHPEGLESVQTLARVTLSDDHPEVFAALQALETRRHLEAHLTPGVEKAVGPRL